jgi:diacylglycerol kinase family enzyme
VRVALVYNEDAGDGVTHSHLRGLIERHGHELVHAAEINDGIDPLLEAHPDVVAAAGGDGTVAAAARSLAGQGIPLAILPMGTANNIARSLGCGGPVEELIARWTTAKRVPLDLGVLEGARGGRRTFVEAVGSGLIPGGIQSMHTEGHHDGRLTASPIEQALWKYHEVLSELKPERWSIVVDGVRTTGEFLLVEVLNIPSVGPNLELSADANPSDGVFSIVTAAEDAREALARYLQRRVDLPAGPPSLVMRHGRQVTLEGTGLLHVDDQVVTLQGAVSIQVQPAALEVLV